MDQRVAALAARQHGVVSRAQLVALGTGRGAVAARIRAARLHRVHRGVYAVGHAVLGRDGRWLAAVLACGDGALLSHRSAGALWDLRPSESARIDVTVPRTTRVRSTSAVAVHRTTRPTKPATVRGIPVTTPMRTLDDLAAVLPQRALERAVEQAETLRLLDVAAVRSPRVRRLIATHDFAPTRSDLEKAFLALCRRHGLPRPGVNTYVAGFEVDFAWPEQRLIVETDSHRHHGTRAAFERDRARDARLTAQGWRVVRFTYRQLLSGEAATVLIAILGGTAPAPGSARRSRSRARPA